MSQSVEVGILRRRTLKEIIFPHLMFNKIISLLNVRIFSKSLLRGTYFNFSSVFVHFNFFSPYGVLEVDYCTVKTSDKECKRKHII